MASEAPLRFWIPDQAPHRLGANLAAASRLPTSYLSTLPTLDYVQRQTVLAETNLCYGILYGATTLHAACRAHNRDFVHVDHGFWGRTDDLNAARGYFRFSLNSQAQMMRCEPSPRDFKRLGDLRLRRLFDPQPRRGKTTTAKILYQPPSTYMRAYWGLPADFDVRMKTDLRNRFPDRAVMPFFKGSNLDQALQDCALFVSFNSTAGIRALELGVDIENTTSMNLWAASENTLPDPEWTDRREVLFAYLCGRTWNFAEIESGEALGAMALNGEIP